MSKLNTIKISAAVLFLISLFCTVDLGFNFLYNLVPEFLDGYTTNSILHGIFQIFGDHSWSLGMFFNAFETSAWISFALLVLNVVLHFYNTKN